MDPARRGGRPLSFTLALLAVGLLGLLMPSLGSAELMSINEKGDAPDAVPGSEGCDSITGGAKQCNLRAAVEESNATTNADDTIAFDNGFIGDPNDDKVTISGTFPAITDKVKIFGDINGDKAGGRCESLTGVLGPCVQLERSDVGTGLVVEADEVEIQGLAIVGMTIGIDVLNESTDFGAKDNWVGLKLNGETGANGTGIFLDPNSDRAVIGGPNEQERNVVAGNGEGLDLMGASEASITGNYFGMAPDGVTQAPNFDDLEITDSTAGIGFRASSNSVGLDVGEAAAGTAACDGGCNVFGSRGLLPTTVNIDLSGEAGLEEAPAFGPTSIGGNYIGLDASGAAISSGGGFEATGIRVGGADSVLIGGDEEGQANHITGGAYGILAGKESDDLQITNNGIGLNGDDSQVVEPPAQAGIFDSSEGVSEADAAVISQNFVAAEANGVGIEQHGTGALISGNTVCCGKTGIRLWGESGSGSTIDGNVIDSTFENGVLIENDNNLLTGNLITASKAAGIRIQSFLALASTGNVIGGDFGKEENTISESQGNAIEVAGDEDDDTQIAANHGSSNAGLFIDLGADGPGNQANGPNDGIQPPTISTAIQSGAAGGARPLALVRVFRKTTTSAGELQELIGKAAADGSGNWSVSYAAALPVGTPIAATQSDLKGTSELTIATTAPTPTEEGGGGNDGGAGGKGGGGGNGGGGNGGNKDLTPPQTTILTGPKTTSKRTVKFKFASSEPASAFRCKLDKKPFKPCVSPKKYKKLKPGRHVFKVSAVDRAGNEDKTPAVRKFRILR